MKKKKVHVIITIIIEYAWICINKQDSEYASGLEYGMFMNMQKLHRALNMPQFNWKCLNRTWICLNMSEFTITDKVLNMSHTMYIVVRSLYKLKSTYWEISEPCQRSNKMIIAFSYSCQTLDLKFLRGFWICVGF